MCILGEPTENKLVLAHFGSLWLRLSTHGPFVHTAFSEGRRGENSIVKMQPVLAAVLEWLPSWEEEMSYGDVRGVANVGSIEGGFGWRASRTPHRTDLFLDLRVPPDVPMADARRKALDFARSLDGVEAEVYVTAPGAEIDEGHPLVSALGDAHAEVFGVAPERDVTRWFSDASVLTRYGIATVNYGTSSGLPGRGAGREPRDRRAREDCGGLRACGDEGLRGCGVNQPEFRDLMERLARGWSTQDTDLALSCFTPDAVYMEPPDVQLYVGHDQLRPYFAALTPGTYMRFSAARVRRRRADRSG